MPQFKVYAAEIMPMGEVAVIITTAVANAGGYPRAESFLIVPDEQCTLCANSLAFDVKSFQDSPVELNEEFMLQEALNQASIDLRLNLAKLSKAQGIAIPHASPTIAEDNRNLLVHIWIRGHCFEKLNEIMQKTEFAPLRDFLLPLTKLPAIRKKGL